MRLRYYALMHCTWKTFLIHQTFVRWALYILFKFVKYLITHLGLGNVWCVRWFSWTLLMTCMSTVVPPLSLPKIPFRGSTFFGFQPHASPTQPPPTTTEKLHVQLWIWTLFIADINGLVQDCSNSSALALELLQSWTMPSMFLSIFF